MVLFQVNLNAVEREANIIGLEAQIVTDSQRISVQLHLGGQKWRMERPPVYQNPPNRQSYQPPRSRENSSKQHTPLGDPITQFYERLTVVGYITQIPAIVMSTYAKWIDHTKICDYHSSID